MTSLEQQQIDKLREVSNFFQKQPDRKSQQIHAILECLIGATLIDSLENLSQTICAFVEEELKRIKRINSRK